MRDKFGRSISGRLEIHGALPNFQCGEAHVSHAQALLTPRSSKQGRRRYHLAHRRAGQPSLCLSDSRLQHDFPIIPKSPLQRPLRSGFCSAARYPISQRQICAAAVDFQIGKVEVGWPVSLNGHHAAWASKFVPCGQTCPHHRPYQVAHPLNRPSCSAQCRQSSLISSCVRPANLPYLQTQ
jgi:hypothetical protein